ncbi:unnamed protein product [Gordionus sp. m RMFG-2023]
MPRVSCKDDPEYKKLIMEIRMGYAFIGGLCDPNVSCAIIHPTNLETSITIGHETGHLLGAVHDMENQCSSLNAGGIMHYESRYPRRAEWSECSVREIGTHLGNSMQCMANGDSYRGSKFSAPSFDLNNACRSLGNYNLQLEYSNCTAIRCISHNGTYYILPEPLNFLPCNQSSNQLSSSETGAICYKGVCILKSNLQEKAGEWSSWSSWSACQGDNIIGYATRDRKCDNPKQEFGGLYCQGNKIDKKVCRNKVDRNNLQNKAICSKYDRSSIYRAFDAQPCVLFCFVQSKNINMNIGKAVDGTIIKTEDSLDMCLNGDIIPIGCDDQFYSIAKRDKCGICNGNNSQCVTFEVEKKIDLTNDLTDIANLTQGITFLYFKLKLGYFQGLNGPGSSIVLVRNGTRYMGIQISSLTDITYEVNTENEIILSEALRGSLIIQLKNNLVGKKISVNYKLRYATPR